MKTILTAALAATVLTTASAAWAAEEPAAPAAPETKAETKSEAAAEPAAAPQPAEPAASADVPRAQGAVAPQLIEGAPLGNANVHVHIVQKKPYINEGRHEVAVYPGVLQINGKFTQHYGVGLMYAYHLFENLALQVTPIWNYWNQETSFNQELIEKGNQKARAATALLLEYGAVAGVEVTPMYGKFAFYQGTLGHFTLVFSAGAGLGNTRIQLRAAETSDCGSATDPCDEASFAAIGPKFMGSVGAGFRVFLGERVAIRLEVRDLIYTARVDKINGCSLKDMTNLKNGGQPESTSCKGDKFNPYDYGLAISLLEENSSDVLNNISVYLGASFLF